MIPTPIPILIKAFILKKKNTNKKENVVVRLSATFLVIPFLNCVSGRVYGRKEVIVVAVVVVLLLTSQMDEGLSSSLSTDRK